MTAPLTHTAPVPLPAMQEPGPAFVREAAAPLRSRLRPTHRHRHMAAARTVLRPIRPQKPRRIPPIRPKRRRTACPARAIQPGTSHPEPHCRPTPPRRKARTRWRRIRCIPGRRRQTRCRSFRWKARCGARPTRFGATRRLKRYSVRHRPSFRPASCRRPRLRPSPKTPSFRASSCCSPQPTPFCSTAIWATYGCC